MTELRRSFPFFGLGVFVCLGLLAGCDEPLPIANDDAGTDAGSPSTDSGIRDMDASPGEDAGPVGEDAGRDEDAGMIVDDDGGTDGGPAVDPCEDGVQNGDETDVDCGGATCAARCEGEQACSRSTDCESRVCISNVCIAASCTDGIQNGDETDRDCGGSCDPCPNGDMCLGMSDCADATAMCTGGFCQPGACADGVRNGSETATDCGGGICAPCSDGRACALPRDCASSICIGSICLPAECTNGVMDGTEIGVDCGGDCPGCPDGTACTDPAQCLSGRCEGSVCASCADGVTSGAETDVDCGGVCSGCSLGEACTVDSDCAFGDCLDDSTCDGPTEYYREDFEGGAGGWVADTGASWALGTPTTATLNMARSGVNAWVTNLDGNYASSEDGSVVSPVIDLSAATEDPAIELSVFYATESCCDELVLEVSIDGGTTWTVVGDEDTGPNWYNTVDGWAGTSGGWLTASTVLTGTAGQSSVQVRLHFNSDGSITNEGVAFDDIVIRAPIPNLSVSVATVPDVCGGVVASVTNTGEVAIPSGTFRYGIGGARTTVTLTDFAPGATEARTLIASNGDTVTAEATSAIDGNPTDDVASVTLTSRPPPPPPATPYAADFDVDNGGWASAGTNSTWEHGTPAGTDIPAADSGTGAWVTNLDGNYVANERSFLVSPCFDASASTADLRLTFAQIYETEGCCDEGWIEYSIDGGRNWAKVLGGADAMNWYNDTSNDWWDGSSSGWRTVSATLPGTAGKPAVRIRHAFSSDSSAQEEGFGVDTVRIEPAGEPDLAVELRRTASCGRAEAVVTNVGSAAVSAYALTLVADGVPSRMTILETILPGDAVVYPVDVRTEAGASVEVPGDIDTSNDSATIRTSIPVTGGFFEDFEADGGDFTVAGTRASWEHGVPGGVFISGPASGVNAWVTSLDGNYSVSERSTLTSPCFDFSALTTDPRLSFAQIFQTEACCDHGWVEMSVDGGATWRKLGRTGEGTNWYNDPILDWWSGTSGAAGTWRTASHALTGSAGSAQVRFRFVMYSDGGVEAEGFGVDDVSIMP